MTFYDVLEKIPEGHTLQITKFDKYEGTIELRLISWGMGEEILKAVKLSDSLISYENDLLKKGEEVNTSVEKYLDHLIDDLEEINRHINTANK